MTSLYYKADVFWIKIPVINFKMAQVVISILVEQMFTQPSHLLINQRQR